MLFYFDIVLNLLLHGLVGRESWLALVFIYLSLLVFHPVDFNGLLLHGRCQNTVIFVQSEVVLVLFGDLLVQEFLESMCFFDLLIGFHLLVAPFDALFESMEFRRLHQDVENVSP